MKSKEILLGFCVNVAFSVHDRLHRIVLIPCVRDLACSLAGVCPRPSLLNEWMHFHKTWDEYRVNALRRNTREFPTFPARSRQYYQHDNLNFYTRISVTHTHLLWFLSARDRPVAITSTWQQHSQQTNIHGPDRIRTCNPNRRAAADPCFGLSSRQDRPELACLVIF